MEYSEKTSRCREENEQIQPTYDAGSGNRTRATLRVASALTTAAALYPYTHIKNHSTLCQLLLLFLSSSKNLKVPNKIRFELKCSESSAFHRGNLEINFVFTEDFSFK